MRKRVISLLMCTVMICSMLITAGTVNAAAASGLSISDTEGCASDTFTVTLEIPEVAKVLENTEFNIRFDKTAFEVVEEPSYTGITGGVNTMPTVDEINANGYYSLNLLGTDIQIGRNASLTAKFRVKDGAQEDSYEFRLTKAAASYTDESLGVPVYALKLKDFTPAAVIYTVNSEVLCGDVNGDGFVDDKDSTCLNQYFAGYSVNMIEDNADVNGDDSVTRADAMILARHLAGWLGYESLPVE